MTVVATNRKAYRDYTLFEAVEVGIALKGTEVKSLRNHRVNLTDSFARMDKGELYLYNMHISPYEQGNINNVDPRRTRKLLLHKSEIRRFIGTISQKGFTLVPLKVYFKKGLAKVEIAIAKGKKLYDKRDKIKKEEHEREVNRAMRGKR